MNKGLLVTALALCTTAAFAQKKIVQSPKTLAVTPYNKNVILSDLPDVAKWEHYNYTGIQLAKSTEDPQYIGRINTIIEKLNHNVGTDSILIPAKEAAYVNKYKADIINALKNLENNGKYVKEVFYGTFSPVRYCSVNNALTFYLGGLYYPEAVTLTKTNTSERLREVISKFAAPNIALLTDVLNNSEVKQVALAVNYPINDVNAESSFFKYETLVLVVPKPVLLAFAKTAITEKELLAKAGVYAHTTDMARLQTQKVDILN